MGPSKKINVIASNKKINVPILGMSLNQIDVLLDTTDTKVKEDIENLMNDLDT